MRIAKRKTQAFKQVSVIYEEMKERKRVLQSERVAEFWRQNHRSKLNNFIALSPLGKVILSAFQQTAGESTYAVC